MGPINCAPNPNVVAISVACFGGVSGGVSIFEVLIGQISWASANLIVCLHSVAVFHKVQHGRQLFHIACLYKTIFCEFEDSYCVLKCTFDFFFRHHTQIKGKR